jgi:hypothetical protein
MIANRPVMDDSDPSAEGPGERAPVTRPSLPVVSHVRVQIGEDERRDLARLARRLLADEPLLPATEPFGGAVEPGLGPWSALLMEDHSAISLYDPLLGAQYSYRALLLAGDDDLVAVAPPRCPEFERYCRAVLGLGQAEVVSARTADATLSLTTACAKDPDLLERAAERARRGGGLNVIPYIGNGGVWTLAGKIAAKSGLQVRVAAPPPRLVRRANDKLWFAERVSQLFGEKALPPAFAVFSLAALAGRIAVLAKRHATVAVKLTGSASSAGNLVLDSADIESVSLAVLRMRLRRNLQRLGWRREFPLLVTAWEHPIIASPSVQLWIPRRGEAEVVVEGIFDQIVLGTARVFGGAAPTALPGRWQGLLADEASRLACLFQELGYFGRCSFDAIVVGGDLASAELHWVECNGRWGGTSIPMTLANRLTGDWQRRPFVVIGRNDLQGRPQSLARFLGQMEQELYRPPEHTSGIVVLSPGRIEQGSGYELAVFGTSLPAAQGLAERIALALAPGEAAH